MSNSFGRLGTVSSLFLKRRSSHFNRSKTCSVYQDHTENHEFRKGKGIKMAGISENNARVKGQFMGGFSPYGGKSWKKSAFNEPKCKKSIEIALLFIPYQSMFKLLG